MDSKKYTNDMMYKNDRHRSHTGSLITAAGELKSSGGNFLEGVTIT